MFRISVVHLEMALQLRKRIHKAILQSFMKIGVSDLELDI